MSIVEMLGTIKAIGAVPALVNLLRSKPITATPLKEEGDFFPVFLRGADISHAGHKSEILD